MNKFYMFLNRTVLYSYFIKKNYTSLRGKKPSYKNIRNIKVDNVI